MAAIIKAITGKPDWQSKIQKYDIVCKWKEELLNDGIPSRVVDKALALMKERSVERENENDPVSHLKIKTPSKIWRRCEDCECLICSGEEHLPCLLGQYEDRDRDILRQLKQFSKTKCICKNSCNEDKLNFLRRNIYHSMKLISSDLRNRFKANVNDFESRKIEKDYHPGSNDQMLDIIHPSLYCYAREITKLNDDKDYESDEDSEYDDPHVFRWLPAKFHIIRDSSSSDNQAIRTQIESPINNLDRNDPRNAALYEDIANIFSFMVPGFERILNQLKVDHRIRKARGSKKNDDQDIQLQHCQVIVKIASAEVNVDKPEFNEGSWHLEGIEAEKIIATGIYYYDVKNIEPSYLRFRTTLGDDDIHYPQDCSQYVTLHYGLKPIKDASYLDMERTINLGRIPTKRGLCLFFPNFMQHRVSKIKLTPGATEGHRSILAFFLVNPFERAISTDDLLTPPQEAMTKEEALMFRELLMFDRKYEYREQDKFYRRSITLCEH